MNTRELLPVMEHFYTLQGEGKHTGSAAYFVRLGGCDIGCPWCDVKESWSDRQPLMHIKEITKFICDSGTEIAVITGGEPLMWQLDALTKILQNKGIKTHIETSGAYGLSGKWDWFCLSPKKRKLPTKEAYLMADELKVIVRSLADFGFAERQAQKVTQKCTLYLQPEWEKRTKITPHIIRYIKQNPKWHVSLQTHKYMDIP